MTKICTGCFCEKPLTEFYPRAERAGTLRAKCKTCVGARHAAWREKNPGQMLQNALAWNKQNSGRKNKNNAEWYARHKTQEAEKKKVRYQKKTAPFRAAREEQKQKRKLHSRLAKSLRCRVWQALAGIHKSAPTLRLLGCSIEHLRAHLESQFYLRPGMSWDTRCFWHVDHIRPCADFNLADPEQQKLCFHFSNQRPIWAIENMQKGARC